MVRVLIAVLVALVTVGCGGRSAEQDPSDSAPDATSATDADLDASSPDEIPPLDSGPSPHVPAPACPTTIPKKGDPCPSSGQLCEYGTSDRLACNTLVSCAAPFCQTTPLTWTVNEPNATACGATADAAACGCAATYAEASDAGACPGSSCVYGEGTCTCVPTMQTERWSCGAAPTDCPAVRPRMGTACDAGPDTCPLPLADQFPPGACCGAITGFACREGTWVPDAACVPVVGGPPPPCAVGHRL